MNRTDQGHSCTVPVTVTGAPAHASQTACTMRPSWTDLMACASLQLCVTLPSSPPPVPHITCLHPTISHPRASSTCSAPQCGRICAADCDCAGFYTGATTRGLVSRTHTVATAGGCGACHGGTEEERPGLDQQTWNVSRIWASQIM